MKKIVTALGGRVEARSEASGWFEIPARELAAAPLC
jgi:hypothetical protein